MSLFNNTTSWCSMNFKKFQLRTIMFRVGQVDNAKCYAMNFIEFDRCEMYTTSAKMNAEKWRT